MTTLNSYPGGKAGAGVYQKIINQIPPHTMYIEPFIGGGAILRKKRPADSSIAIDRDPGVLAALGESVPPNTSLICGDAIAWLATRQFGHGTFLYCDPPYLPSAVLTRLRYEHVLSPAEHRSLLEILRRQRCHVMVSGYWSPMYAEVLHDWRAIRFPAMTRGGFTCEEWLWMNYAEPKALHDYRFLGENFRQREKLRRQQARWRKRLEGMDRLQRLALMDVLEKSQ